MRVRGGTLALSLALCVLWAALVLPMADAAAEDCGWSTQDVKAWVESVGLAQYAPRFVELGVTGCHVPSLTHEILQKQMGIARFSDRHRLMNQVYLWNYFPKDEIMRGRRLGGLDFSAATA